MAVPVTVPRLGLDTTDAFVAEWYQPDGATVRKGEPVYRLEVDYIAIEVEADDEGVLRHRAKAGAAFPPGEVVAYILAPGERLPGEESKRRKKTADPEESATEPATPKDAEAERPRGAYPLADVLAAGAEDDDAAEERPLPQGLPWDAFPGGSPEPEGDDETFEAPAPILLFPRIVNQLKQEAELAAEEGDPEEPELIEPDPEPDTASPRRRRVSAWDLVPGETDFNPEWVMERVEPPEEDTDQRTQRRGDRFQASSIRNLALGRAAQDEEPEQEPEQEPDPEPELEAAEPAVAEALTPETPAEAHQQEDPPTEDVAPAPEPVAVLETPEMPEPAEAAVTPVAVERPEKQPDDPPPPADEHAVDVPAPVEELPPTVVAPIAKVSSEPPAVRRSEPAVGPALWMRVAVDMNEPIKMRDQLTREWWGSNVRPTDEDIVLRAIARALEESAAFRRRSDTVGMRVLVGPTPGVYLLPDAATRPFRDAVASMAALREKPPADIPCVCTLTPLAEYDLDEAMPALTDGQPLAFSMGGIRDVARFRGEHPYRAREMVLTISYDSGAVPEPVAARLLSRVRELLEAPYALLAH